MRVHRLVVVLSACLVWGCDSEGDGSGGGGSAPSTVASTTTGSGPSSTSGTSSGQSSGTGSTGTGGGGTTECPLPDYPDESCTGVPAGTELTVFEGDMEINDPDTVIEGMEIHGCVLINAPGVIIRNSKISCPSFLAVASYAGAYEGTGVLIEDSEIDCAGGNGTAVGDTNFTVRRSDISGCENGFDVDGDVVVEHSYIHDLYQSAEAHTDGAQITPVGHNIRFTHNTMYANEGTSAIISPNISAGVVMNVLVEQNLMAGGAYTLYCAQEGAADNYRVIDNHFSTVFYPDSGAFGPWTDCEDETEVTGNVWHETAEPLPGQ